MVKQTLNNHPTLRSDIPCLGFRGLLRHEVTTSQGTVPSNELGFYTFDGLGGLGLEARAQGLADLGLFALSHG